MRFVDFLADYEFPSVCHGPAPDGTADDAPDDEFDVFIAVSAKSERDGIGAVVEIHRLRFGILRIKTASAGSRAGDADVAQCVPGVCADTDRQVLKLVPILIGYRELFPSGDLDVHRLRRLHSLVAQHLPESEKYGRKSEQQRQPVAGIPPSKRESGYEITQRGFHAFDCRVDLIEDFLPAFHGTIHIPHDTDKETHDAHNS